MTDSRLLVVRHEASCPPGLLADAAGDARVDLDVVAVDLGDRVPAGLDGAAGLVVLGGTMGVADAGSYPHLEATMALIRRAAAGDVPTLGICLGGQLAAQALGGRAYQSPRGLEYGWIRLDRTPSGRADPVLGALTDDTEVFASHHDVFDPPPGADLLALGGHSPNQAFRLGSVVGVQFHPEVDAAMVAEWYDHMPAPPRSRDEVVAGARRNAPLARRLLDAFCRLASPVSPGPTPRR